MKASEFIIEAKKDRRDKKHNRKPKSPNPVAKNAMAAVGGGGFGSHKDKKAAMKRGEEKHKKDYSMAEAAKKPNATTRHLRDYPFSDKDVAKPVKKPENKKPQQGVAEGRYTPPKNTYYIMQTSINSDEGRSVDVFDLMYNGKIIKRYNLLASADRQLRRLRAAGNPVQMEDEQGVAEGSLETDNMVSHIGQVIQSIYPRGGDKKTYMKLVAQEMPRIVRDNPKLFRRAFGMAYDRFFHIDQDDDFDYTDYSMRKGERGVAERFRDPKDWDEGNTEPPNNFSVYINGKKWKVFQGRGRYAGDQAELRHYQQLRSWAAQKSAATGKKWEVYVTGEPATEGVGEAKIPFAGAEVGHKEGPAGQWRNKGPKAKKPAKPGDLVG